MANKIYTNHGLEEYSKKYGNKNLKKVNKVDADKEPKLLQGKSWWLINDTYYEIPSGNAFITWWHNLGRTGQIVLCSLLGVAVTTAIVVPIVIASNNQAEPEVSIENVDKVDWSNKHYDKNGNAVITIKGKNGNVIKGFNITIENYVLSEDDYTYNKDTGELLIKKACVDAHKGKININPIFKTEVSITLNKTSLILGKGDSFQFSATVTPLGSKVSWYSSDESVLSIDINTGLATASKDKTGDDITITAKAEDSSATCKVKVQLASHEYLKFTAITDDACAVMPKDSSKLPEYVIIPETDPDDKAKVVTQAWEFANTNIKSVVLPRYLSMLDSPGFSGCTQLKEFIVDSNNTELVTDNNNSMLFNKNKSTLLAYPSATGDLDLTSYTSLDNIAYNALSSTTVTSIKLPESINNLEDGIGYCYELTKINIPENLDAENKLLICPKLVEYDLSDKNPYFSTNKEKNILFNNDKTRIVSYLGATGDIDLNDICPDVEAVSNLCFAGSNLEKITLNNKLASLGTNVFSYCPNLKEIYVPTSVVKFGDYFDTCPSLTDVYFEQPIFWTIDGTETIDIKILSDSKASAEYLISLGEYSIYKNYDNSVFDRELNEETGEYKLKAAIPDTKKYIPYGETKDFVLPTYFYEYYEIGKLTEICSNSFDKFVSDTNFKKIILPSTIKKIDEKAFLGVNGQSGLKKQEIVLNEGLEEICKSAFKNCGDPMYFMIIPSTVTKIEENAFEGTNESYSASSGGGIIIKSKTIYENYDMVVSSDLINAAPSGFTKSNTKPFYVPNDATIDTKFTTNGYKKGESTLEGYDLYVNE